MKVKKISPPIIIVNYDAELRSEPLYRAQWMIAHNLAYPKASNPEIGGIPRREWRDAMTITFARHSYLKYQYRSGTLYNLPYVDEVFGEDEDMRWLSLYLEPNYSGLSPLRMSTKIERLRLINLFLKVRYPNLRKHLEP